MAHVPKVAPIKVSSKPPAKDGEAGTRGSTLGTASVTAAGTASGVASGSVTANAGTAKGGAHDRDLVRRAQANDREAYEELVKRHQQRVFAVASGILRRHEDVEDIAQQVFIKAYFSLKRFDGQSGVQYLAVPDYVERVLGPAAEEESAAAALRIGLERRAVSAGSQRGEFGRRGAGYPAEAGNAATSGVAAGGTGRAGPADADFERSGRIFD